MDDLRREVTEAFDQDQTTLGDLSGVRERIVRSALAERGTGGKNRVQLAAGLAAVLIAAVVIAGFAYVRLNSHPIPEGPPRPSPSPTPLVQALNVPDSTPVILYADPVKPDQIDGVTWDGKLSGTAAWGVGRGIANPAANPAVNLFASPSEITDRSGRVVGTGAYGAKSFAGTWADDSLHFCMLVPFDTLGANGVPTTLQLVAPGSAPKRVAQVGHAYEQVITFVAACSVRMDRAVVVQGFGNSPFVAQYWVVQLSTGKILWTHRFTTTHLVAVRASPDGRYIAENAGDPASSSSTIFGADGSVLARLKGQVEAFSSDGSLAVIDAGFGSQHPQLVRWADGNVVWTASDGYVLEWFEPQPDGASVAIWVATIATYQQQSGFAQADLYVIAPDSQVQVHIANTRI